MGVSARSLGLEIIVRAWEDDEFRSEFIADPRGALKRHLNVEVPEDLTIDVHEETSRQFHFVLPEKPSGMAAADLGYERLVMAGGLRALGHDDEAASGSATSNYVSCHRPA